jgi:hypothetical protein
MHCSSNVLSIPSEKQCLGWDGYRVRYNNPQWTSFLWVLCIVHLLIKHPCRKQCVDWNCYSICHNYPHSTVVAGHWFLCNIYTWVYDIQWWEPSHHAMIQISNFGEGGIIFMFYARGHMILCFVGSIKLYILKRKFMNFKHFKKIQNGSWIVYKNVRNPMVKTVFKLMFHWRIIAEKWKRLDWVACVQGVRLYPVRCPSRGEVLMYLYNLIQRPHGAVGVVGGALATQDGNGYVPDG